jgi:hypothetical protein
MMMVLDMAHARWRKKLLESRKVGELYQMIGMNDEGVKDIIFMYRDGQWQFRTDFNSPTVNFSDVDEATQYILSLGVEQYDSEFGI